MTGNQLVHALPVALFAVFAVAMTRPAVAGVRQIVIPVLALACCLCSQTRPDDPELSVVVDGAGRVVVVGSWIEGYGFYITLWRWRKENPDEKTPLIVMAVVLNMVMWQIATMGGAAAAVTKTC